MRTTLGYIAITIVAVIGLIYFLFSYYSEITLVNVINSLFSVGLVLMSIGLFLYVTKKGFFDGFTFGLKRFWSVMSRKQEFIDEYAGDMGRLPSEIEEDEEDGPRRHSNIYILKNPLLYIGGSLFLLSFIMTFWV